MSTGRLMVISHSYSDFVKGSTDELASYYNEVYVLVRLHPLAEISTILPFHYLKPYRKESRIDPSSQPANVKVIPTPIWYIPTDTMYRRIGTAHFRAADAFLQKSGVTPDLIHAHFAFSAGYAGAKLKEKYQIPVILTAHGYDVYDLPFRNPSWNAVITYALETADHIIAVSNSNLESIKKLDVHTPVSVIPNGFDSTLFRPMDKARCRKLLNLPEKGKIVVNIGNMYDPVKGHSYLIDAMQRLVEWGSSLTCYIVGSGRLHSSLQHQINSLGLKNDVVLAGARKHEEIPLWINASDCVVLPSLNEGNPTVMFETLGCGIPFVGTAVGGVPDVISSRDYGLLTEPANPEALAEKIREALEIRWDRENIVRYAQRFTWRQIGSEIMEIHRKVAGIWSMNEFSPAGE